MAMRGRSRDGGRRGRGRDRMRRALVLLVAGVWLALAGLALSGAAAGVSAAPLSALVTNTPADTPIATPTYTPTPTDTPKAGKTPTPSVSPSPSVTVTATATSTPAIVYPTPTSAGDIGPQPTKVVSQLPSAGDGGGSSGLGGLSPGAFGSNGLLLAGTSSCIVGLLGILIAAIALVVLLRGGYGPFLKALLRGKRAGTSRRTRTAKGGLAATSANNSSNRYGFGAENDERGGGWSDPRWSRGGDDPGPGRGSRPRRPSRDDW